MFIKTSLWFLMIAFSCSQRYENIAFKKPTFQTNRYHSSTIDDKTFDASKAVDGQKTDLTPNGGQCAISMDGFNTAKWWVNLMSIHSIHEIRIYYRTDNAPWDSSNGFTARFMGFFVYISNTTTIEDGYECFHDTTYNKSTIPAIANITCPIHGQYVIYMNKRPQESPFADQFSQYAHNELCEVEVYGCSETGYYGPDCSFPCPNNCLHPYCHIETGACQGCKPGYQGHKCEQPCIDMMYGQNCAFECGACLGKTCNPINGRCFNGCDAGYKGKRCKNACFDGTFGNDCKWNCSVNCKEPKTCNKFTGECNGGCQPGWEGPHCNQVCKRNVFGLNCTQPCGKCREESKCDHINGSCLNGCDKGFKGIDCINDCSPNTYGFDCMANCSTNCINNTCDSVTGNCPLIKKSTQPIISSTAGSVIGGITGLLLVCILTVFLFLFLRRQQEVRRPKHSKTETEGTESTSIDPLSVTNKQKGRQKDSGFHKISKRKRKANEADVDEDELIHSENPYGDFYANETTIRDIPLNQLESVIAEKRKDNDDGFQREYATLPYGELHKCDDGKREENMVRNRYKTTFPYDHSRVKLKTNSGSDYINANYIEGAEWEREYIAAQGPKQNTLGDFWAMIWQKNVFSIVMVTNLKEGTKVKCNQYWPDANKSLNFGVVSLKLIEEKRYAFYIVRRMTVMHNESKESRTVTQYHYTAWPDHGTPDPLCLIVFLDHVTRTGTNQKNSPTIVHCSAGIGRTGTYIALDALKRIGQKRKKVNVAEYVKKMRENRMNMVQTYEQYMTIFLALNEIFKAPVNSSTIEDFIKRAGTMTMDEPANHSALRKEFQLLMKIRTSYTDADYTIAKEHCSDAYTTEVLPLDKYMLYLSTPSTPVTSRGSFINAIYVLSITKNDTFIVTKYPPERDAVDFLRLLCEQESDTVICMDPLRKIESCKAWLPCQTSSSSSVPPFTMNFQSKTETDVSSSIVHIRQKNSKKPQTVTIIEPRSSIKTSGTPLDTSQLRSLVSVALSVETENPVIVVSSDGAALCGAFCALHNVIQQINMDDKVDVFTTVRMLQVRRPEFCSSLEEYGLVVKSVNDHIQRGSENIYSNQ